MKPALLCALLALAGCKRLGDADFASREPPLAVTDDPSRVRIPLEALGLAEAQRFNTQPTLSFPFFARSDRVLTSSTITLRFAEVPESIRQLDVSVNQENVATLLPAAMRGPSREVRIPVNAAVIGDKNLLTLRLRTDREGPCGKIPAESWKVIRSGELEMESAALPLPDDLSLLPLPFVDRHFDREASVALVLPAQPTARHFQEAARVAGWFGVDTGVPLRFTAHPGALPDTSAVVLIDDPHEAVRLGLPPPEGPQLRMMDHPRFPHSNVKLLLVAGRTADELALAVRTLAAGNAGRFKGPLASGAAPPPLPELIVDQPPRWMAAGRPMLLSDVTTDPLTHSGVDGGRIAASFRLPPDVWVWPDEFVSLDLRWEIALPREVPQPRLDVLFNGAYLARLPDLDPAHGETRGEERLRVHRSRLKGFNELVVFIDYADAERICTASAAGSGGARVRLLPDSTLHIERYGLYSSQPDVEAFVNDGYPFTRAGDLSQTAVVLSSPLEPAELGLVLSTVAQFGSITGVAGAPSFLSAEEAMQPGLDKDLLVVGTADTNRLLRRWDEHMPLHMNAAGARPQIPVQESELLGLFNGRRGHQELGRARGVLSAQAHLAALASFESPVAPGRTVVAIGASTPADLRSFSQFRGPAEGVLARGDLLVVAGGSRYRFAIGPSFGRGSLEPWTMLRWFLAQHPLLLVPFLLIGVLSLAALVWLRLRVTLRRRLGVGAAEAA